MIVRDGIVHLSGVVTDDRARQAAVIAAENVSGVRTVHDHLWWVDPMSGMYLNSPEDDKVAKGKLISREGRSGALDMIQGRSATFGLQCRGSLLRS